MSMSKLVQTSALLAALASTVAAHTAVMEFECNGQTYQGYYQGSKVDPGNNSPAWWTNQGWGYQPIMGSELSNPDMIAHMDASPSPYTVEAPAGQPVTFTWAHSGSCGGDEVGWDCSHHGWTATYLAPCNGDCKDVDKTTLEFFKIHESALIDYRAGRYSEGQPQAQTGYWGTDAIFYDGNNQQSVTIPKGIPSGNYVLRTEVASIHNNGAVANRQFWPQAFNIQVTGGDDSAQMPAGVKGTDIYHDTDALLVWDLYWHTAGETFANAPGPAIIPAAGGNSSSSSSSSSSTTSSSSPSSSGSSSSGSSTSSSSSPSSSGSYSSGSSPSSSGSSSYPSSSPSSDSDSDSDSDSSSSSSSSSKPTKSDQYSSSTSDKPSKSSEYSSSSSTKPYKAAQSSDDCQQRRRRHARHFSWML